MQRLMVGVLCGLLVVYRRLLSPLIGPHCRFHPTCSAYALAALRHYPLWRALRLAAARVLRCHPWHPGGYDPLPVVPGTHHSCSPASDGTTPRRPELSREG